MRYAALSKLSRALDRVISMPMPVTEAISSLPAVRVSQCVSVTVVCSRKADPCALSVLYPRGNHKCSDPIEGPHFLLHDWVLSGHDLALARRKIFLLHGQC